MNETMQERKTSTTNAFDARALAATLFEEVRAKSHDGVGITRESYGPGEDLAHQLFRSAAEAHGLEWTPAETALNTPAMAKVG